jgi:hypothetical protein
MTRAPDADAVDSVIVALARSSDLARAMEPIWRYAVRDQWHIGHKAIFAAQSWRTLQSIGWQHAEPVLRSLVGIGCDAWNLYPGWSRSIMLGEWNTRWRGSCFDSLMSPFRKMSSLEPCVRNVSRLKRP